MGRPNRFAWTCHPPSPPPRRPSDGAPPTCFRFTSSARRSPSSPGWASSSRSPGRTSYELTGQLDDARRALTELDLTPPDTQDPEAVQAWVETVAPALEPLASPTAVLLLTVGTAATLLLALLTYAAVSAGQMSAVAGRVRAAAGSPPESPAYGDVGSRSSASTSPRFCCGSECHCSAGSRSAAHSSSTPSSGPRSRSSRCSSG